MNYALLRTKHKLVVGCEEVKHNYNLLQFEENIRL